MINPSPEQRKRMVSAMLKRAFGRDEIPTSPEETLALIVKLTDEKVYKMIFPIVQEQGGFIKDKVALGAIAAKCYEEQFSKLDKDECMFILCSMMAQRILEHPNL